MHVNVSLCFLSLFSSILYSFLYSHFLFSPSLSLSLSLSCFLKVIAKFDFQPQEQGELGLTKGDEIVVVDKSDANWWKGRNKRTNEEGLFPVPYVAVKDS